MRVVGETTLRRVPLAALLLVAALALPTAASASVAPQPSLILKSGHYTVQVAGQEGSVILAVSPYAEPDISGPYSSTTYVTRGSVSSHRLQATFGSLGSISMRFQPSPNKTWRKPNRRCKGSGRFLSIKGTWHGSLHFRGEGGYLKLNAKQAKGVVNREAPQCESQGRARVPRAAGPAAGPPDPAAVLARPSSAAPSSRPASLRHGVEPSQESFFGEEVPYLEAGWRHAVHGADFFVGADSDQSHFIFSAEESLGSLAIFRYAQADADSHRFRVNRALTHADVRAPKPFRGQAHFGAAPDGSATWSGTLTVSVPGEPRRRLTGGPFEPKLALAPELAFAFLRSPANGQLASNR